MASTDGINGTHFHRTSHCSTVLWEQNVIVCGPATVFDSNLVNYEVSQCYSEGNQDKDRWLMCFKQDHNALVSKEVSGDKLPLDEHGKNQLECLKRWLWQCVRNC
jgi:hypothetical protein